MTMSVPSTYHTQLSTSSQPTPELDKAYELSYFVNTFLQPFQGTLVHFSQIEKDETILQSKYFIWTNLSHCKQIDPGVIHQNIQLFGLDPETNLESFLQTKEVVSSKMCDLDILQNGDPTFNKTTYQITLLTDDFFQRQKNAESVLNLILPKPLCLVVQGYIS